MTFRGIRSAGLIAALGLSITMLAAVPAQADLLDPLNFTALSYDVNGGNAQLSWDAVAGAQYTVTADGVAVAACTAITATTCTVTSGVTSGTVFSATYTSDGEESEPATISPLGSELSADQTGLFAAVSVTSSDASVCTWTVLSGVGTIVNQISRSTQVTGIPPGVTTVLRNTCNAGIRTTSGELTLQAQVPSMPPVTHIGLTNSGVTGTGDLVVDWDAADPNLSAISSYEVSLTPEGVSCAVDEAPFSCTFQDVSPDVPHTINVRAKNDLGFSADNPVTSISVAPVFDQPSETMLSIDLTAGGGSAPYSFLSCGGDVTSSFLVVVTPGPYSCWTTVTDDQGWSTTNEYSTVVSGAPTATGISADAPSTQSVTLHGTVSANYADTSASFVVATTRPQAEAGLGTVVPVSSPVTGQNVAVSATATGLTPGRTYYYALQASNRWATVNSSSAGSFTTVEGPTPTPDPTPPAVQTAVALTPPTAVAGKRPAVYRVSATDAPAGAAVTVRTLGNKPREICRTTVNAAGSGSCKGKLPQGKYQVVAALATTTGEVVSAARPVVARPVSIELTGAKKKGATTKVRLAGQTTAKSAPVMLRVKKTGKPDELLRTVRSKKGAWHTTVSLTSGSYRLCAKVGNAKACVRTGKLG